MRFSRECLADATFFLLLLCKRLLHRQRAIFSFILRSSMWLYISLCVCVCEYVCVFFLHIWNHAVIWRTKQVHNAVTNINCVAVLSAFMVCMDSMIDFCERVGAEYSDGNSSKLGFSSRSWSHWSDSPIWHSTRCIGSILFAINSVQIFERGECNAKPVIVDGQTEEIISRSFFVCAEEDGNYCEKNIQMKNWKAFSQVGNEYWWLKCSEFLLYTPSLKIQQFMKYSISKDRKQNNGKVIVDW